MVVVVSWGCGAVCNGGGGCGGFYRFGSRRQEEICAGSSRWGRCAAFSQCFVSGEGWHCFDQEVRRRDGGEVEMDLFLRGDGITTIRNRGARDCGETQRKLF